MSISGCGALELPNVNLFLFDVGGAKLFNQNNYHYGGGGVYPWVETSYCNS